MPSCHRAAKGKRPLHRHGVLARDRQPGAERALKRRDRWSAQPSPARQTTMVAGIVVMVGGGQQPAAQQNMMFGGAQLKPLKASSSAPLGKVGNLPGGMSASLKSLMDSTQVPRKRVRPKRRRKILPLIQYRAPPPQPPRPAGGPRRGPRRQRPVQESDDQSTADPFAFRQSEPLSKPKHATHWSAMLRGEQKSMAEQVTRFPERDEPAMWAAKDEQHAIECRQKAYAEAAEARRADDAVNAYKRDLELRRRQREQQQKKEAEEEKAKKEADARAAAARKRALPKKRRLRPELSPLKAGQAKTVSIQEPPKQEKKVVDVNAEDEGDLWDAILNDDAPSAPPVVVEQKKATHYGHISPEKSQQMQRPMRDVVAEQKARWKKKREQEKRFLKQQVAKARRDLDKRAHVRVDARPLRGNSNLVKAHQGSLMPGFDASGSFIDKEGALPLREDGVRPMTGKKISRRYGEDWLAEHFKSLVGGGGVVAFTPGEDQADEEMEPHESPSRPFTASLLANRPSTTASSKRGAASPASVEEEEASPRARALEESARKNAEAVAALREDTARLARKNAEEDTRRARFEEFKATGSRDALRVETAPEPDALVVSQEPAEEAESSASGGAPVGDKTRAALEARLREIFDRVDTSGDGEISVVEAVKALRKDDGFAEVLGFDEATRVRQEDGTKDQLILALGALDSDGDKKISWAEFRRVALDDETPATPQKQITNFAVGTRIEARYEAGDEWYAGVIEVAHEDGSYDVLYDDGDRETNVSADLVKREGPDSKRKTPSVAATPVVAAQTPATAASDDYGDSFDDFEEPPSTAKKSPMPVVAEGGDDARQLDFEPESAPELAPAPEPEADEPAPAPVDPLSPGAAAFEKEKEKLAQQKAEKAALSPYKSPPPEKKAEMLAKAKAERAAKQEAARIEYEAQQERDRIERERREEEERIERERLAALKAEEDRIAAERAEAERLERERLAAIREEELRIEKERREAERIAREKAAAEEAERERRRKEMEAQLARERAEMEERNRIQAEQMDKALAALAAAAPAPASPPPSAKLEPPTPGTDYGDDEFENSAATPKYEESFEADAPATPAVDAIPEDSVAAPAPLLAPTPEHRPPPPSKMETPFSHASTEGYGEDDDFEDEDFADFED